MGTLNLKTWNPTTYQGPGFDLTYELKRTNPLESKLVLRAASAVFKSWGFEGMAGDLTDEQRSQIVLKRADGMPEEAREVFSRFVRNVSGLVIDDEPATTGAQLFDVADHLLVFEVLDGLVKLSHLTPTEGKDSASPSGFSAGEARQPDSSGSDATSTGAAGGPPPSDATAPLLDADLVTVET